MAAACGDAMGAATENLTTEGIIKQFGGLVSTFIKPPPTAFAFGSEAGQITDDFSIIYMLAKNIVEKNEVTEQIVQETLLEWSEYPQYFDRFAGPSTRAAILAMKGQVEPVNNTVVDYAAKATNGAAMKISPAGLINPGDLDQAIEDAITITRVTHNNHLAISGACAVACAVSQALTDDANLYRVIQAGFYGARRGETRGKEVAHIVGGASVEKRMDLAVSIAQGSGDFEAKMTKLANLVGSGLHISEAVPAAFGLLLAANGDAMQSVFGGVNIGYDTDTVATITGSIAGALEGAQAISDGENYLKIINEANNIDIEPLANALEQMAISRRKGKVQ